MRMGLAIDAACDLSQAFLQQHDVAVMPITVRVDGEVFMDDRDPAEIPALHRPPAGQSQPLGGNRTLPRRSACRSCSCDKLVLEQDCVFCLTITATRSPINEKRQPRQLPRS